jgi:hypothetical protein
MPDPIPNLPPRNVFAFWRWRRRSLALALPIAIASYFVSAVPVTFAAHKWSNNRTVQMVVCVPFLPVFFCSKHSSSLATFMRWEFETLTKHLGPL